MEELSVFDIVGPRMTGPSSSHTAGAIRLALTARHIAGRQPERVCFILYGSFAETGKGHGTDKALIAGMLGMEPDDARIRDAYRLAREAGMLVEIEYSDAPCVHPNTVRMIATAQNGTVTDVLGCSVGGGRILITEFNGLTVELTGEYPTLVIRHRDEPGVIAEVSHVLASLRINIAFMRVFRHGRGEDAYMTIETDQSVNADMQEMIVRLCPSIDRLVAV